MDQTTPLLEARSISKIYPVPGAQEPLTVLDEVSFTLKRGEMLGIIGPSGSGKSTLLNIAGTLDFPSRGEILLEGRNLAALSEVELNQTRSERIGFVFQMHHLLPQCTVLENVLLPCLPRSRQPVDAQRIAQARAFLSEVGLESKINMKPGFLSGGERQRAAVVRALINQPCLLLADEPTGSLDRHSAEQVIDLLFQLNREKGIAMIVVTHSQTLASRMDRVLELRDAKLAEVCG